MYHVCVCTQVHMCVYKCSVNVFMHAGIHVYVLLYTSVCVCVSACARTHCAHMSWKDLEPTQVVLLRKQN